MFHMYLFATILLVREHVNFENREGQGDNDFVKIKSQLIWLHK